MAKGDYKSNQPRKPRRPSDNDKLLAALRDCVTELETFRDDASCDHSVGICWCSYHRALENAKKLVACHERSDKFIAELEA